MDIYTKQSVYETFFPDQNIFGLRYKLSKLKEIISLNITNVLLFEINVLFIELDVLCTIMYVEINLVFFCFFSFTNMRVEF